MHMPIGRAVPRIRDRRELLGLTGIRFYAALLVYLYHVVLTIPGMDAVGGRTLFFSAAEVGVSFFFLLSGFILTYNYADVFRGGISAAGYTRFVWDRLTKIYPVHFLTLLLVLPIATFSPHLPLDWRAVPLHLLLLQCFWPSSTPAFSGYLNVPSWSISCEWFFYLLAPVAMFFALGNRRRWVPVVVVMGYACGLGLFLWHGQSDEARLYFVSRFAPSRFVEFLLGVFSARLFLTSSGQRLAGVSGLAQATGIGLIIAGAMYRPYVAWPLWGGLLYVPGSILLILGLAHGRGFFVAHLSRPGLNRLGVASFSLYLIHAPLLRAVRGLCLHWGWAVRSWPAFGAVVIAMFMVVQTAALLTCYGYEIPLQKRLRSFLVQRREVAGGARQLDGRAAEHAMPRHVVLVARDNPELVRYLQAEFASDPEVEVVVDRRLVERRRNPAGLGPDRRKTDRRARPRWTSS
jgi:peptidoglycan/LPS O-acetylase OafA/YrhL